MDEVRSAIPIGWAMKSTSGKREMMEMRSSHQKKEKKYPSHFIELEEVEEKVKTDFDQVFPISSKMKVNKQTAFAVDRGVSVVGKKIQFSFSVYFKL
jgi:hypothetical protein